MRFLDNVLTDFIENAPEEFSDATYSAIREKCWAWSNGLTFLLPKENDAIRVCNE